MKDVDFDNLKSLVEYMYKGEANVPQQMLPSFIQTAESLQIRGLAEGASKQKLEQVAELNSMSPHMNLPNVPVTPQTNVPPFPPKSESKKGGAPIPDSILAARLKTMVDNPPMHMLDFQEQLALAARQAGHPLGVPPPMKENKKRRKMDQQQQSSQPNTSSPVKPDSNGHKEISVKKDLMSKNARLSPKISQNIMAPSVSSMVSNLSLTNNNDESDSDVLKIDEDGDRKETSEKDFEIAEVDNGYGGMDDSEEEITMDNHEKQMQRSGKSFLPFLFLHLTYMSLQASASSTRGLGRRCPGWLRCRTTWTTRIPCKEVGETISVQRVFLSRECGLLYIHGPESTEAASTEPILSRVDKSPAWFPSSMYTACRV